MSRSAAIESARSWLATSLGVSVIYAMQDLADAHRPAQPYATVEPVSDVSLGMSPRGWMPIPEPDPGGSMEMTHYHRRVCTVQVGYYGDDAGEKLGELRGHLQTASTRETLRTAEIGLRVVGDCVDNFVSRDTSWEPQATQDLAIDYVSTVTEDLHPIDSAEADITLE